MLTCLGIRLELTACNVTAEDESDDAADDVLVDPRQPFEFDLEPGLLADFAAEAVVDGFVEFQDAAGWLPCTGVGPTDDEHSSLLIDDGSSDAYGMAI